MKKTFLMVATVAALPVVAHAWLQVNLNSSVGSECYSEDSTLRLIMCGPLSFYGDDIPYSRCPDTYAELLIHGAEFAGATCYIGNKNGYLYACETVDASDDVCRYCTFSGYTPWESVGSNRVRRQIMADYNVNTGANWRCDMTASGADYGCAAGYYANATFPGANMTCNACPSSGGVAGRSAIGNIAITGCYIPSGNNFSDSYGSGVLVGDCHYTK